MALSSLADVLSALESRLNEGSEKLPDLSTEVLLERHADLKAEREAMPDTLPPQDRASVTNKVKRIEAELRTRSVDFIPLRQANQPVSLENMTEDELVEEFQRIQREYADATAGQKASMTVRLKAMKREVANRLGQATPEATDTITPDPAAEEPTVEELETVVATATEEPQTRSRRRRS
jgi:hypothetical protein